MWILEGTARYACLLLAPAEGFGLWSMLFSPLGKFFGGLLPRPGLMNGSKYKKVTKVTKRYLNVHSIPKIHKSPINPKCTSRSKVSNRYQKVQGILNEKVP